MTNKNCLNCEKELTDQYCPGCGQKADTHRITLKNFIFHDVLHGTFHIEKGILFTAKQSLVRPGKAALDYISGKRKRYYNVFYLILIVLGLMFFLNHLDDELLALQGRKIEATAPLRNEASKTLHELKNQKSNLIIFLFIPLAASSSFILFRRKKLNLAEHSIIAGMVLLGILLLTLFGNILSYFDLIVPFNDVVANTITFSIIALILFHIVHAYGNAFGNAYSKLGIAYRMVLFFVLLFIQAYILFFILIGFITNWKFGPVTITPFG